MELFAQLAHGFAVTLTPTNLVTCLIGVVLGTAVGVLPGLGPTATISLLLPVTFRMDATASIIMVSGIYYGAMYGGSITSILVRIPGEAASMVTCLDGYQMARQGRAGAALGIAAFGSFIAGIAATLGIALVGPGLARAALAFGPAEYASLVLLGLLLVTSVSDAPFVRSMTMVGLGLLAATIGLDPITSSERFTAGNPYLQDGLGVAVLAMGLFGIAEVLALAEQRSTTSATQHEPKRWRELLPTRTDWRESAMPIARGSVLGFALGLLPGGGALVASFASYVVEKRFARDPTQFGRGAIAGVAGPESANNAAAQASFIPLLSLGIPANVVMGVILGALMIHGIAPGPKLAQMQPQLFWGVIASMFVGNLMLVALNVPLVGLFVRLLHVPAHYLAPLIVLFCVVGAYSLRTSAVDVAMMGLFGLLGWGARKLDLDPAPFLLAFVLGSLFETSLRQALLIGVGSPAIFVTRPLSATLLAGCALVLLWPLARWCLRRAMRR